MTSPCNTCGAELQIGEWPFCPHGPGNVVEIGDDIPGGQWIENLGPTPQLFYSKRAILDAAAAKGLRLTDKWAGHGDKYLTNWAAGIDPQTLANAEALVRRQKA